MAPGLGRRVAGLLAAALLVAGCSGDGGGASSGNGSEEAAGSGGEGFAGSRGEGFAARPADRLEVASEKDLPYTSELLLDVYRPVDDGPWPTVVFFHGGEEKKGDFRFIAADIAAQGTVVFLPQYRATPAELDPAPLGALEDAACAMRYARMHTAEHGGSTERIVAAGFSLGGNLAAVMAVTDGTGFAGDCDVSAEMSAVADGFVGLDAVYDFAAIVAAAGDTGDAEEMGPYDTFAYVADSTPSEAVIFTGVTGELRDQGERLRDDLTAAGWDVTYVNLPLSHGSFPSVANGTTDAIAIVAHAEDYTPPE